MADVELANDVFKVRDALIILDPTSHAKINLAVLNQPFELIFHVLGRPCVPHMSKLDSICSEGLVRVQRQVLNNLRENQHGPGRSIALDLFAVVEAIDVLIAEDVLVRIRHDMDSQLLVLGSPLPLLNFDLVETVLVKLLELFALLLNSEFLDFVSHSELLYTLYFFVLSDRLLLF